MLNLIHLNAECMKQYTQMTHVCMDQEHKIGVEFKKCETHASDFLQQCQTDKLRNLTENHMNAHYFHITPPSQWHAMGLAHHKWNLKKPANKSHWGKWESEKPHQGDFHNKWVKPFMAAKAQFGVDKWNMHILPYDPTAHANINIVNVIHQGENEDWTTARELKLLEEIEGKQYEKIEGYLKKEKIMTDDEQKDFLKFLKETDTELDKPYKDQQEELQKKEKVIKAKMAAKEAELKAKEAKEAKDKKPAPEQKPAEPKKEEPKKEEPKKEEPKKEEKKPAAPVKKEEKKPATPEKKEEKAAVFDIFGKHDSLLELFSEPESDMEMVFGENKETDEGIESLFADEEEAAEPADDIEALFQD